MPAIPFQAATWRKLSDIPSPTLFGALSGAVQGVYAADYSPTSNVLQTAGPVAHSFTAYFGAAQGSADGGRTWSDTYRGDSAVYPEYIVQMFNLVSPTTGRTIYFQVRASVQHSFFAADGSLLPGGIALYGSESGLSFSKVQDLYSWPHVIADPVNTGGNNVVTTGASFAKPILIPGSGPDGEDAFWSASSFQLDVGGNNNRQSLKAQDIWRSFDGIAWEKVRSLIGVPPFNATIPNPSYTTFIKSFSGKIFLAYSQGLARAATLDILTTSWAGANNLTLNPSGYFVPMYGGTWLTNANGTLIGGGFAQVSCDDGANFQTVAGGSLIIPVNRSAMVGKIGPSEAICITSGFNSPTTETVCYYSADGGETFQGGEVWTSSTIGESPVALFIRSDGHPLVITQQRAFFSTDQARGVAVQRTTCPLANAGLATARKLNLCGHSITVNPC